MSTRQTQPSFRFTYKRADGDPIVDFGWVTNLDVFDHDDYPVELVQETWERTGTRRFWHLPTALYSCEIVDAEPCDGDAVAWWRSSDGVWLQVCNEHEFEGAVRP